MEVPKGGVVSNPLTEDELNANLDVYPGKENRRIPLPDIEEFKKMAPAKWVTGKGHAAAKEAARKARIKKNREKKAEAKKKAEMKKAEMKKAKELEAAK